MKDLTEGNETTRLVRFAIPMLLGNVFQQFYNMVDSMVVGRFIGTDALAAVGTAFPVIFLMVALIMGVSMGSTVLISQYFGARNKEMVKTVVQTSYIFLFGSGVALTAVGVLAARPILVLMNVPESILPGATTYLQIIFAGMVTTFGYNGIAAIMRGLGDSRTPLYLLIAATLLNVALDLLFVVGFGWGIAGAAWATVISQAASFIGTMVLAGEKNEYTRLRLGSLRWDRAVFVQMLRIGLPSGVQQTLVSVGMMTLSGIVNGFGPATMAAYGAVARIDSLTMMPAMNLGQALMTFTGQNIGAGKTERVRRGHLSAVGLNLGISLVMTVFVILARRPLMGIFTTDAEVVEIGMRYLVIVGIFYAAFGTMFINNGVMRGAGDVMVPMVSTIFALWLVRIPVALLLTGPLGLGSDGVWWSIPAGWLVGLSITTAYYLSGRWKGKAVAGRKAPGSGAALPD